jgi:hypothetical protein
MMSFAKMRKNTDEGYTLSIGIVCNKAERTRGQ